MPPPSDFVLESPGLALVACERRVAGAGPDGEPVRLTGHGCAMLRPAPDGSWQVAAGVWHVGPDSPRLQARPGARTTFRSDEIIPL